eukprot:gb/GECH01013543.1/.p1 GENE.gb/GECH01013543.1/~~gb/GECH01013543.1/.p1  ORF type:complete len:346 (+),score=72.01 gb/GECH01013543.1/:1-1038(+)
MSQLIRPRRNRANPAMRSLIQESYLSPHNLVLPVFVIDGGPDTSPEPIPSMPGVHRLPIHKVIETAHTALSRGIHALALFPVVPESLKSRNAEHALDPDNLLHRCVRRLREEFPCNSTDPTRSLMIITDVALDPYSSDGHDGLVDAHTGRILNDDTVDVLGRMAVAQAQAGADMVAPSDMMDGRVGAIRRALDDAGYAESTAICAYSVKYASAFYGPFRDALDSAPRGGDKKTYQMDVSNAREAEREVTLDEREGADWVMVKPGMPYLDVVHRVRQTTTLPVAVYQVSGEYAMLRGAGERGWLDYERVLLEALQGMRRAGADIIFSYGALDAARMLNERRTGSTS